MFNQASAINLTATDSSLASTSTVPPSFYKGKLMPLIEKARKELREKISDVAITSALVQSLKSGDQFNIDWALAQDVTLILKYRMKKLLIIQLKNLQVILLFFYSKLSLLN
jgi:hypothetical protein